MKQRFKVGDKIICKRPDMKHFYTNPKLGQIYTVVKLIEPDEHGYWIQVTPHIEHSAFYEDHFELASCFTKEVVTARLP